MQAETDRQAKTATLRRLIRDGYAKLGLPAPTMTPGMALEPLLYRQEKVLGKGAFGLVSLARSVVTGELVAMKTVDKAKLTSENLKKTVEHEIRILKRLRHKRIVRLYEVIETARSIILILEYVDGGTVQQLVKKNKKIDESDAQRILYQLIDAVEHCHQMHVCHRDLKLENFMLARNGRSLKLIDFGLSVVWKPGQNLFKSYGTPCYMAPEIIKGRAIRARTSTSGLWAWRWRRCSRARCPSRVRETRSSRSASYAARSPARSTCLPRRRICCTRCYTSTRRAALRSRRSASTRDEKALR